jgi:hypothetical protein
MSESIIAESIIAESTIEGLPTNDEEEKELIEIDDELRRRRNPTR